MLFAYVFTGVASSPSVMKGLDESSRKRAMKRNKIAAGRIVGTGLVESTSKCDALWEFETAAANDKSCSSVFLQMCRERHRRARSRQLTGRAVAYAMVQGPASQLYGIGTTSVATRIFGVIIFRIRNRAATLRTGHDCVTYFSTTRKHR